MKDYALYRYMSSVSLAGRVDDDCVRRVLQMKCRATLTLSPAPLHPSNRDSLSSPRSSKRQYDMKRTANSRRK
jgi:hypothetical protein